VIHDYGEYLRLQREVYLAHESEVVRWRDGQVRYIKHAFAAEPGEARILDCACGDGVGLAALRDLGFSRLTGVELAPEKAARAAAQGFDVRVIDMHSLDGIATGTFDTIVSSHTLEHSYRPGEVLAEFRRVLVPGGRLHVVLPFPDPGPRNERGHPAKYELCTDRSDGGEAVTRFFTERGFGLLERRADEYREKEIWLSLVRD